MTEQPGMQTDRQTEVLAELNMLWLYRPTSKLKRYKTVAVYTGRIAHKIRLFIRDLHEVWIVNLADLTRCCTKLCMAIKASI